MIEVKQSTATVDLVFFMADETDGVTGKTGLSPTVQISKNGGSFASPAGAVSEIGSGFYKVAANSADSGTLGMLALRATGTGANPAAMAYAVVENTAADAVGAIDALNDLSAAEVKAQADQALSDYDPPTKMELDVAQGSIEGALSGQLSALNDLSAAEVKAQADQALSDYDPPTKTELDSGLAALNDLSAAEVKAQADQALSDYDPPTKAELDSGLAPLATSAALAVVDGVADQVLAIAQKLESALELDGAVYRLTANALEQAPAGGGGGGGDATAANQTSILADLATLLSRLTGTRADLLDNLQDLDAAVSSRLAASGYTAPLDSSAAQAAAAAALGAYDPPTKAELDSGLAGLNDLSAAEVKAQADQALSDYDPPTRAEATADKAEVLSRLGSPAGASVSADIAAIEQGSAPTAAEVADAVWDELLAEHAGAGSAGAGVSAAGASGDPWATVVPGAYGEGTAGEALGRLNIEPSGNPIAAVPLPPEDPDLCVVYLDTEAITGAPVADLKIRVKLESAKPAKTEAGRLVADRSALMTHDAANPGRYTLELESGLSYRAECAQLWASPRLFEVSAGAETFDLGGA